MASKCLSPIQDVPSSNIDAGLHESASLLPSIFFVEPRDCIC
jgi:hypothetical protein